MKEILKVDVGHLLDEEDTKNFISLSTFNSFHEKYNSCFDEIRASLEQKISPITRSFLTESSILAIKDIAESLRGKYENILVIGIGGSTLGFRTIVQYLKGPFRNFEAILRDWPRVFVLDNVDPILAKHLGDILDFRKTALVYISKSGSTPEPAANFVYFYKKYREAGGFTKDIVIICDPGDNGINRIARNIGCHILHVPSDLPGRYSVLSPVGFLPSELIGIDSRELLEGAAKMHHAIVSTPAQQNAIFTLGSCLSELSNNGKSIHVLFNYSNILSEFGLWFVQLWSESLGKKKSTTGNVINAGTTPLAALGATDQHSLLQLFKEGPDDKVFGFITVDDFPSDITLTNEFPSEVEYSYFAGHTLSEQLKIEQLSTEISLVRANRPCYRIFLKDISASTLGALFYFMESLVVFTAKLWNVNPFDQPGVEEGKNITYSLMGRKDHASMRSQYEAELAAFDNERKLFLF
ncbi:MAG: glucose-6-phosphate isomerase [Nitrospirae bacterium]|nr:glucose-6-phosphate isomerase [Nitrospirota bacterium]